MTELVGRIIKNRYRVEKSLGRGGMAEVYQVWDAERNATLAMKVLHEDLALDNAFLRRFQREAQTLRDLQHPNIVRFYELDQDGRLLFMLMDYVDGETLKHKIFDAQGPMPFDQVMAVMRPLCQALQYAHNKGYIHADVKPGNVMIDRNGRVMLADFGIARLTESATVTMLGAGTPAYMSPEQARGKPPSPQTDIYALGIILYEMLAGERPFTGEQAKTGSSTSEKIRWEQLNLNPISPRRFNRQVGSDLETVVMRCLQKDPRARFASPLELLDALEKAMPVTASSQPVAAPVGSISPLQGLRKPPAEIPGAQPQKAQSQPVTPRQATRRKLSPNMVKWGISLVILLIIVFLWGLGGLPLHPAPMQTSTPTLTPTPVFTFTPVFTSTPVFTPTAIPLPVGITDFKGVSMRLVSVGEFTMGGETYDDEKPIHDVYLDAFYMDTYEVTNARYQDCVNVGVCDPPKQSGSYTHSLYYGNSQFDNYPVIYVDWNMATTYCEWRGAQLPTEAEWEKAARGTDGRTYPWGEGISCSRANYYGGSKFCVGDTSPVGSYESGKSPYGIYDMAGNVWEWVADWYSETYYQSSPFENPVGPGTGQYRALRGGSWDLYDSYVRSAFRRWNVPLYIGYNFGFRCSRSLP
jgi:serine/threonine-protein kinase